MEDILALLEEHAFLVAAVVAVVVVAAGVFQFMFSANSLVDVAAVSAIPRGSMKEVSVPDSKAKILVVHTDKGEFKALSAKCPHKGASMAKGVLAGDCVVCPWHAARFNVSTGDIEDGPVCEAMHSFPTTVSNGRVHVDLPRDAAGKPAVPLKRTQDTAHRAAEDGRHFIIVGGGPAGAVAAETLRAEGFQGRVTLVTKEADLPYDRTALSKTFTPKEQEEAPVLLKAARYGELEVNVLLSTEAVSVDTAQRSLNITTADGAAQELAFDKLLIATGGNARTFAGSESFKLPGADLRGVFVLRDAADVRSITAALAMGAPKKNIVVVGSSFIGMEAAAFFIKRTKSRGAAPPAVGSVTVVGMEEEPFERVLGKQVGSIVRQRAEKEGVAFHMRDTVTEFVAAEEDDSAVAELELRSGTVLPADIVIIGAGIIPATAWLEGAEGITTAEPRQGGGVICDEFLSAHASGDIYVAGDVAHFPFAHSKGPETAALRIEHYDVAMDHGRIAARNMLGKRVAYDVVPFFWTGLFGMSVRYAGHARRITDTIWHGTPDAQLGGKPVFTAYYVTDDHITGVVTVNDDPKAVACLELFRAGAMPSPEEVRSAASFDPVEALKAISARAGGD